MIDGMEKKIFSGRCSDAAACIGAADLLFAPAKRPVVQHPAHGVRPPAAFTKNREKQRKSCSGRSFKNGGGVLY
ncbi:MAG: hypothetical protein HDT26_01470 [Subdoligranulum sp.]|nr:hypothetical protein [Subdoligranulum sp.]